MRFRVGPYAYRVRVTEEPPVDDATGGTLLGKAVLHGREILIWAGVAAEQRLEVLLHELTHCWLFQFPRPANEEEAASFFAAVTEQTMRDLDEQGGVPALVRLRPMAPTPEDRGAPVPASAPDEEAPAALEAPAQREVPVTYQHEVETRARPNGGRAQCAGCELIVADGSIVTTPAKWDRDARGLTVERALYCAHCDKVQAWTEGTDLYGRPNGAIVSGPRFIVGAEAEQFLRDHAEATGMIVV